MIWVPNVPISPLASLWALHRGMGWSDDFGAGANTTAATILSQGIIINHIHISKYEEHNSSPFDAIPS